MKLTLTLFSALLNLTAAAPVTEPQPELAIDLSQAAHLESRQFGGSSSTANEFSSGSGCRDVIFFFARGSGEVGNMGTVIGPPLARALKSTLGSSAIAVQGVPYAASIDSNILPGGTDSPSIATMKFLLESAASRCPNSVIVAGGYSQGAALCHRAIENLGSGVKERNAGVVTFGDTKNRQDGGQIPNFPKEKIKIFCATGDLVCSGSLVITAAHLSYGSSAGAAAEFLVGKIRG